MTLTVDELCLEIRRTISPSVYAPRCWPKLRNYKVHPIIGGISFVVRCSEGLLPVAAQSGTIV